MRNGKNGSCAACITLKAENAALRSKITSLERLNEKTLAVLTEAIKEAIARKAPKRNEARDAAMVRLRDEDSRAWTWGKLGKKFGLPARAAKEACKRHRESVQKLKATCDQVRQYHVDPQAFDALVKKRLGTK